jgi:hypothetical protein
MKFKKGNMKYQLERLYGQTNIPEGEFCSIRAAQKAMGIPNPNDVDCIFRMSGWVYHITRIHSFRSKTMAQGPMMDW